MMRPTTFDKLKLLRGLNMIHTGSMFEKRNRVMNFILNVRFHFLSNKWKRHPWAERIITRRKKSRTGCLRLSWNWSNMSIFEKWTVGNYLKTEEAKLQSTMDRSINGGPKTIYSYILQIMQTIDIFRCLRSFIATCNWGRQAWNESIVKLNLVYKGWL